MNWDTLFAVVLGAVVSIVTTIVAKLWIEPIGERRAEKRRKNEAEDERIRAFQTDVLDLAFRLTALRVELSLGKWVQIARIKRVQHAFEGFAAFSNRVTLASTNLLDDEARAIAQQLREATGPLVAGGQEGFLAGANKFIAHLRDASDEIGEIIRRRMK